jgi:site-specific DNA-cytosine methylase
VKQHRPRFVVLENVGAMLHRTGNKDGLEHAMTNCDWLRVEFTKLNYHLNVAALSSHDFLLPQKRRRVWMLAELNGCDQDWSATFSKMADAGQHIPVNKFIS